MTNIAPTEKPESMTTRATASSRVLTTTKRLLPKSYLILVLVVIIIIGYYVSGNFLTIRNAENVIAAASIVAVLAVGQFFVILTGGIDLSVGSTMAMSTVIVALTLQTGMSAGLSVALTLGACAVAGFINGLLAKISQVKPSSSAR